MNFFGHSSSSGGGGGGGLGGGRGANEVPFSIDDAFDIPEDDDVLAGASAGATASNSAAASSSSSAPIIRNGQLRLSSDGDASYAVPVGAAEGEGGAADGASTDSASLIQSGEGGGGGRGGGGGGYYEGPPQLKYWWLHPKIRSNVRVVVAACMLVVLGLGLIACGIAVYCIPTFKGIQGIVFVIAGVICFVPGAYHIVYVYLAVKGKRGFEFNHLPLFNN